MGIQDVAKAMLSGCYDSFKGMVILIYLDREMNERMKSRLSPSRSTTPIRRKHSELADGQVPARTLKKHEESKVLKRTLQCGLLNGGIFLMSIWMFEYGLLPFINFFLRMVFGPESLTREIVWSWTRPFLSLIFETCWVIPLFILSKIVNSLWFQDIADSAYKYSGGRPQFMQSISKLLADTVFSVIVQALFLVQAMIVSIIPIYCLGYVFSLVHMCLLYSLYAFEYKWFNNGWELHKRLSYIEANWPYFIGFGLPLAVLTQLTDSLLISAAIFSILFPFFIISGNEANPVTGVCDFHLHLFSPVIALSNIMLNSTIGRNPKPAKASQQTPQTRR